MPPHSRRDDARCQRSSLDGIRLDVFSHEGRDPGRAHTQPVTHGGGYAGLHGRCSGGSTTAAADCPSGRGRRVPPSHMAPKAGTRGGGANYHLPMTTTAATRRTKFSRRPVTPASLGDLARKSREPSPTSTSDTWWSTKPARRSSTSAVMTKCGSAGGITACKSQTSKPYT